ncbi:Protein still life, isoform SIF type 1 [Portunus trituberculatus]|uniref:Protein still life, isoform SIF type 1 n=1 Tax=Portunus trituberculatus TaxID=210409 RepID=A0A5B7JNH4_PORTR|nr:Protein still life, isoform SIF type 1 [Portunus trituberculatus]
MGNKLSCSCAPLIKKTGYRYEDSPWNPARRRDGHLLRSVYASFTCILLVRGINWPRAI